MKMAFSALETMLFSVFQSPRSGRQHIAQGGAEGETLGQVRSAIKPVKRAAATGCRPLRGLRSALLSWGFRLVFSQNMLIYG